MKKIYITYLSTLLMIVFSSCGDDFLEVEPKGTDLEANYYKNQQEAFNGLVAVYDVMGWQNGYITKIGALSSAVDDHYAGGANETDMNSFQVMDDFTVSESAGPQNELWNKGFSGIFRANILLQKLPNVPMDDGVKARYAAEAKLLRAYYYFDLVRLFRNVPLLTAPVSAAEMYNVVQAAPSDVYDQIEKDILDAIPDLPITVLVATEGGRFTQGTAKALLGKVYLQLEKFEEAAAQFAEVNGTPGQTNKYGYKLLQNFGNLFDGTMEYNSESILEIGFSSMSGGQWSCIGCTEGNVLNIMVGPRTFKALTSDAPDYVSGWSFLVPTLDLVDFMKNDPRYRHTIVNMDSLEAIGKVEYLKAYRNTGFFLEKYAGRERNRTTGGGVMELNFPQNLYEIRLADTYLMEAEALVRGNGNLTRAQTLLDAVRERVGLGSVPVAMDNIKKERRMELVGEGHRWFDLIRWGDAEAVLGPLGFVKGKHEVLPIPLQELVNTKIVQHEVYKTN